MVDLPPQVRHALVLALREDQQQMLPTLGWEESSFEMNR